MWFPSTLWIVSSGADLYQGPFAFGVRSPVTGGARRSRRGDWLVLREEYKGGCVCGPDHAEVATV
jgi:hypothetical protein